MTIHQRLPQRSPSHHHRKYLEVILKHRIDRIDEEAEEYMRKADNQRHEVTLFTLRLRSAIHAYSKVNSAPMTT